MAIFFISSRDDIDIKIRLEKVSNRYIEAQDNKEDIERFIDQELVKLIWGCGEDISFAQSRIIYYREQNPVHIASYGLHRS